MKKVFSIRDAKISCFHTPFQADSEISAVRSITAAMMDHQGLMTQFPADFELFEIGAYDEVTGLFTQNGPHKFIISCASIAMNLLKSSSLKRPSVSDETKQDKNTNAHSEQSAA